MEYDREEGSKDGSTSGRPNGGFNRDQTSPFELMGRL
jgi:hypothetical protein